MVWTFSISLIYELIFVFRLKSYIYFSKFLVIILITHSISNWTNPSLEIVEGTFQHLLNIYIFNPLPTHIRTQRQLFIYYYIYHVLLLKTNAQLILAYTIVCAIYNNIWNKFNAVFLYFWHVTNLVTTTRQQPPNSPNNYLSIYPYPLILTH